MTESIYRWFDANLLALNVKKSFLLIFSRIGKSYPTVTELKTSKGSISRPSDWFIRFLGILLDKSIFQTAYSVNEIKGFSRPWNYSEAEASLSFFYPSSIILLSYLPLFMLLLVSVDVNISICTYTFT